LSGWSPMVLGGAILLATSGAQAAVPTVVGGELLGATGVNVGGAVYDMEIVEGTCIDLFNGCDDLADFTFTTLADAELAAQALFDQVYRDSGVGNFDTVPNLNVGCTGSFCGTAFPFGLVDATDVSIVSAVNQVAEVDDVVISGPSARAYDSSSDAFHGFSTYAAWTPVPPATPVVVGGELLGATDVNVGGTLYDVQFVDGTCVDLYHGCDEASDFTFATVEDALLAARALQDQVTLDGGAENFDTVPNLTNGCSGYFCGTAFPYGDLPDATNVNVVSAVNQAEEPADFVGNGTTERTYDSASGTFHTLSTYAIWTPASDPQAVPIFAWPAAITMLGIGIRRLQALRRA
jgi:hypothetical protein